MLIKDHLILWTVLVYSTGIFVGMWIEFLFHK